jgi:lysophospholipase L1-like esterase
VIRETNNGKLRKGTAIQILVFALAAVLPSKAAPFKLLAIGDSLTEEYRFELIFSAPDSEPDKQNAKNWVQLLSDLRPTQFSMGNYSGSPGYYLDYRNGGYEYNYGVPGFKAESWDQVLNNPSIFDYPTRLELQGDLSAVDAVLIFVGGNDLSLNSDDAKNDEIRQYIGFIHDYVRDEAPANLPIIVATVPDIGATPVEKLDDPIAAAAARQRVATLNANIIADLGARAHTYIARIDLVTDRIFDQAPFHVNGTEFVYEPDPENPPLHIFCKDGFHPSTVGHALIANKIIEAINQFASTTITPFTNREILAGMLGQNPDQPLADFLNGAGDDGDGLPALLEFLLGKDPLAPDAAFSFAPDGTANYTPSADALRYADLSALQSETLDDHWVPVPAGNLLISPDGSVNIIPSTSKLFYKFEAVPKP